ncbi:hypothetical protein C7S13_4769 [Burkholderia cepacia]|nr:hypothetical protein [Burkholderia cepacia]
MAPATRPGFIIGNVTCRNVLHALAPSNAAAFSISGSQVL